MGFVRRISFLKKNNYYDHFLRQCFIFLFFLITVAPIQAQRQLGQPGSISDALGLQSIPLPTGLRTNMISEYLEMTGASTQNMSDISVGNMGMENFYSNLLSNNSCYAQLQRSFDNSLPFTPRNPLRLNNTTSSNQHGWLWRQALHYSGNNPNLAMLLIGRCGHDDYTCEGANGRTAPRHQQGSLGEDTILPLSIRDEVAQIQAPRGGMGVLPSKYYHTVGAAVMACSLVRNGTPAPFVPRIQAALARTYRISRLCNEDSGLSSVSRILRQIQQSHQLTNLQELTTLIIENSGDSYSSSSAIHTTLLAMGADLNDRDLVLEKIRDILSFHTASELFRTQVFRENERCLTPQLTNEKVDRMRHIAENHPCPQSGEARQICEDGKRRLMTWWADVRWTTEQHRLGARFALQHCTYDPNFMANLEQTSCEALRDLQDRPSPMQFVNPEPSHGSTN